MVEVFPESQLPIDGKEVGITPRSMQASCDKKGNGTDLDTYANCRVLLQAPENGLVPVKTNRMPPMMSTAMPVTVFKLLRTGNRSCSFTPRLMSMLAGMVVSWAPVSRQDCCEGILRDLKDVRGTGMLRSE